MKILYWVGHIGNMFGAYHKYILCLAKICSSCGNELIVLHEGTNDFPAYRNKLTEYGAEYIEIKHTMKEPIQGLKSSFRVIRKYKPDIVHYNFTNPIIMPLAKLLRVPITYRTCHNGIQNVSTRTRLSRFVNNFFIDRFFAVSKRVCNDEVNAGVKKNKIFLNYLGIPLEYYAEESSISIAKPLPTGWNDTHIKKIITIGRFFPEKGMKFVTKVAMEVLKRHKDVIWWIVGGIGPDYPACLDMIKSNNLEERIIFLKVRNDVPALLQQAYLQVVSPVFEGLGLNVLEASILKIPTIGTNIPGLDEAINNFETGFLIEPNSIESMVSAVTLCLEQQCMRNKMGENAKNFVVENFNSVYWIGKLMDFYNQDYSKKQSRQKKYQIEIV